jgi:hypothetical protein
LGATTTTSVGDDPLRSAGRAGPARSGNRRAATGVARLA